MNMVNQQSLETALFWFLVESQEDSIISKNYFLYLNKENSDTCYILHSILYDEKKWKTQFCDPKECLYTFKKL